METAEQLIDRFDGVAGSEHAPALAALEAYAAKDKTPAFKIPIQDASEVALGMTQCMRVDKAGRIRCFILIDSKSSPNGQAYVLAHELGHVVHFRNLPLTGMQGEIFAEAVAFLVVRELKIPALRESVSYLHQFDPVTRRLTLDAYEKDIRETAARLVAAVKQTNG